MSPGQEADPAIAEEVARADPDRFRATMTAPEAARPGLFALYAFNLEIARAPFVTKEPAIAAIRLRWWADAVAEIYDGAGPRRHEVVEPLAGAIRAARLPRELFEGMIEAREGDIEGAPLADRAALDDYVSRTAGNLMDLAARFLGAPESALPVVREFARGAGLAAWLRALPALAAHGREGLPPGVAAPDIARDGLALIAGARARRAKVPARAAPALLAGVLAAPRLERALRGEEMELSEVAARWALLWRGLSGRW